MAVGILGSVLVVQQLVAYDSGYPSTTVTGKHYTPASTLCGGGAS